MMLHGPPGCGKTHSINSAVKELIGENGVAVYCDMSQSSISSLVTLLSDHALDKRIDKLIIVIEDLGGGEITDEKKGFFIPAMTDLLSFLDGNALPWKKMPTVILSTTNYPKNFLANIIDRPGRFDEVVEFSLPTGKAALSYAKSLDIPLTDLDVHSILKGGLGLAHVKKALIWKYIYDENIPNHLDSMRKHSEKIKKDLEEKLKLY
jgi:SpoVK/Ycf46/Vps4 family AAA+-type ATPase